MQTELEIKTVSIPEAAVLSLKASLGNLRYTVPVNIYHAVWVNYGEALVGVFGDGANGCYEWFIWSKACGMRMSDTGYGNDCAALCCGLVESGAHMANGDHDLVLTWKREGR